MDVIAKRMRKGVALLGVLSFIAQTAWSTGLDDMGVGARAPGMVNSFVGVADDANAAIYNPAGLTQLREAQISVEKSEFMNGLDDGSSFSSTYLGYAHPLTNDRGTLGVALHNFDDAGLITERTLVLSYGRKLKLDPTLIPGLWSVGANLKQLHRQFNSNAYTQDALNDSMIATGQSDPLFAKNGYSRDAYAIDLGLFTQFGPNNRHSAGLMLTNLNRPSLSLSGSDDKAPLAMKLGAATRPRWGLLTAELRRTNRLTSQTDTDVAFGAERNFHLKDLGTLALRAGYASGSRNYQELTSGLSFEFGQTRIDYAFNIPIGPAKEFGGMHRIGLGFKFNGLKPMKKDKDSGKPASPAAAPVSSPIPGPSPSNVPKLAPQPSPSAVGKTDLETTADVFNQQLGHYIIRKSEGASKEELLKLLLALMQTYENKGMNLTIVEDELKSLTTIEVKPTPTPVASPTPGPSPKPAVKIVPKPKPSPSPQPKPSPKPQGSVAPRPSPVPPQPKVVPVPAIGSSSLKTTIAASSDLDQAVRLYKQAVDRGLTDRERIEVLEMIISRFREEGRTRVGPELEKLKKRAF